MNKPIRPIDTCRFEHHGQTVNLCLLWAELEYDVKYAVWKKGKITGAKGEALKPYELTDEDADWMARSITSAVDDVIEALKPYSERHNHMVSDEIEEEPGEYNIVLHFENEWRGNAKTLLNKAHRYVVNKVLGEWAMNADPNLAAGYETICRTALRALKNDANEYNLEETPYFRF